MTPDNHSPVLTAIFDNPAVKGILAAVTVVGTIAKYITDAGDRNRRAKTIAQRYSFYGFTFFLVDRLPHIIHLFVAYAVLMCAFVEAAVLADQNIFGSAFFTALPGWVQEPINFLSLNFVFLFFVALAFYLAFQLRFIEKFLSWAVGLVPARRRSLEWANAKWQIEGDAADLPLLATSSSDVEKWANKLIGDLTGTPRSISLALRPVTLSDRNAANVLYFGHVIEEYCSEKLGRFFAWTTFYQALADVAETQDAPFSPEAIRNFKIQGSFFTIILSANAHLDDKNQIPNEAGLEEAVESAFATLRSQLNSDASNLTNGVLGSDYDHVLSGSRLFLTVEAMRRQFAKLFIIWMIKPGATHPDVFRIPFSSGIFVQYIDTGVILSQGSRFDITSEQVSICFEAAQRAIVKRVFDLLTQTKDAARVAWLESERADVNARKLDWIWWIYYRVDTQAYSNSRAYKSTAWKRSGTEIVTAKTA